MIFRGLTAAHLNAPGPMTSSDNASAAPNAWLKLDRNTLRLGGLWTIGESARLDQQLRGLKLEGSGALAMDASGIERLDSTGAWALLADRRALEESGRKGSSFPVPE